ncbi:MAG: thiamine phosphate synthase [Bacteroidales bacterium]|nr:thiamine phosphate synthase [Bacteroidales bacterium]
MKMIVVTYPRRFDKEVEIIKQMLDEGADRIHIRKPGDEAGTEEILAALTTEELSRVTVHYYYDLAEKYGASGIERNFAKEENMLDNHQKNDIKQWRGKTAASCHSIEEVEKYSDRYDYCFLSPIYDSISKEGYNSGFSIDELLKARDKGIINERVIALGGICTKHIEELSRIGFGGIAVLGGIWGKKPEEENMEAIMKRFEEYKNAVSNIKP